MDIGGECGGDEGWWGWVDQLSAIIGLRIDFR